MKTFRSALFLFIAALSLAPASAKATAVSDLTAATANNDINNVNNHQTWRWNSLTTGGIGFASTSTTAINSQQLVTVVLNGTNSTSDVTSYAVNIQNDHAGTNSTDYGLYSLAATGTHNYGVYGLAASPANAGDAGVWGEAQGTAASYGIYGTTNSSAGYAGYFNNTNGGYAAAFMGGNVGIGTATPVNLLDIGTSGGIHIASGVPVGTSMALYNNSGTLTWNGIALATGSSVSGTTNYLPIFTGASSLGNSVIYQSGSNVGIGTTGPQSPLHAYGSSGSIRAEDSGAAGNVVLLQASDLIGPILEAHTDANGNSTRNQTAMQLQFGGNGFFVASSPATAVGSARTFTNLMVVTPSGTVGIGNSSPGYTLQVNGSVAGTSAYVNTSDIRFKKNVQPLDIGLNIVTQLKPVTFEWKDEAVNRWKSIGIGTASPQNSLVKDRRPFDPAMRGKQMGFIAQDVEKLLPSVVVTEDNAEKTKGMKYSELIPVLVKAIQEQQAQLAKDEATIAAMKAKLGM
jgi:hypothetical protein